jgi:DNA-directed RNA polymerase specialized sigma24 family protein
MIQAVLKQAVALSHGSTLTDRELLRLYVQQKETSAFTEIVRRYSGLVWSVCWQLRPMEADAEDAFQATFLVLQNSR